MSESTPITGLLRDNRIRAALGGAILVFAGMAAYHVGGGIAAGRRADAANEALKRYEYADAYEHLTAYLFWRPRDAAKQLLAAQVARQAGSLSEAAGHLRAAEQYGASAELVRLEQDRLKIHAGDFAEVERLVDLCENQPGSTPTALTIEAIFEGSLKANEPARAKWAIEFWLKHRTGQVDQAIGLTWRGRSCWWFQKVHPQFLVDFQQAVTLAPDLYPARLWAAAALVDRDAALAKPHLEWLQTRRPNDLDVRFMAARYYHNLGQPEKAALLLDELLAAVPDKLPALILRGQIALDQNRAHDAEKWLRRAHAQSPDHRELNLMLADTMRQLGRTDEAGEFHKRAREIEDKQAGVRQ